MANRPRNLPLRRSSRHARGDNQPLLDAQQPPADGDEDVAAGGGAGAGDEAVRAAGLLGQERAGGARERQDVRLRNLAAEDGRGHSPSPDSPGSWRRLFGDSRRSMFFRNYGHYIVLASAGVLTLVFWGSICGTRGSTPSKSSVASWRSWRHRSEDRGLPRILLWNQEKEEPSHMARNLIFRQPKQNDRAHSQVCPAGPLNSARCVVTEDADEVERSDAFVYYADKLDRVRVPLERHHDQLWVFWDRDVVPPSKTKHHRALLQPGLVNLFNLTMGHREDADIVVPYETLRCGFPGDKPLRPAKKGNVTVAPEKSDVAWIVGDCEEERFGHQLLGRASLYGSATRSSTLLDGLNPVNVHLFPGCAKHECPSLDECMKQMADNFHFILVSLLPDCFQSSYELIFSAFRYDIIPVVLAPADYTLDVPDTSVVTTAHLKRPAELAKFLRGLLDNRDRYESYFTWKQHCAFVKPPSDLCALCRHLWSQSDPIARQTHPDVNEWWFRREKCSKEPFAGLNYGFVAHF